MPDTTVYQDVAATFDTFVRSNDRLIATVLTGHLAIEELLYRILKSYMCPKEILDDARLSFHQKTVLACGLAGKNADAKTWAMVLKINRLRNEIGHNLGSKKSGALTNELRQLLQEIDEVAFAKVDNPADDTQIVIGVANFCIGFLGAYLRERSA